MLLKFPAEPDHPQVIMTFRNWLTRWTERRREPGKPGGKPAIHRTKFGVLLDLRPENMEEVEQPLILGSQDMHGSYQLVYSNFNAGWRITASPLGNG